MPPKREMLIHKNKIKTQQNTNAKTQKRHDNEHTIETEDRNNEHRLAAKRGQKQKHTINVDTKHKNNRNKHEIETKSGYRNQVNKAHTHAERLFHPPQNMIR